MSIRLLLNRGRNTAVIALLTAICLLVTPGCVADSGAPQPAPPSDAVSEAEAAPLRFAMIIKEKNNPYMLNMYEGFRMACEEIGVESLLLGPDSYTADAQIVLIEQLIREKVAVIAIAANHTDALEGALKKAMDAGICVVSLDSSVNPASRIVHIQQADPERVGCVLIQAAHKMLDGSGKAAIITSTPYATNQNLWLHWMEKEYADNPEKYRDFELLDTRYGDDSVEKTREETLLLLEEEPDLDVIITLSAVSMPAVGSVLQEEESSVLFTGLGLPSGVADYILNGSCPWMYLWNPIDLGYLAAYASHSITEQDITGQIGDTFTAGRLGLRAISSGADGGTEILLGDPVKFDIDNINQWKSVY